MEGCGREEVLATRKTVAERRTRSATGIKSNVTSTLLSEGTSLSLLGVLFRAQPTI